MVRIPAIRQVKSIFLVLLKNRCKRDNKIHSHSPHDTVKSRFRISLIHKSVHKYFNAKDLKVNLRCNIRKKKSQLNGISRFKVQSPFVKSRLYCAYVCMYKEGNKEGRKYYSLPSLFLSFFPLFPKVPFFFSLFVSINFLFLSFFPSPLFPNLALCDRRNGGKLPEGSKQPRRALLL